MKRQSRTVPDLDRNCGMGRNVYDSHDGFGAAKLVSSSMLLNKSISHHTYIHTYIHLHIYIYARARVTD